MSEAAEDRFEGLSELIQVDSEGLLFRDEELLAVVNRGLNTSAIDKGQLDFDERDMTHIEILRVNLEEPPRAGETFTDTDGRFHRIKTVRRTDNTWICECEVAGPDED